MTFLLRSVAHQSSLFLLSILAVIVAQSAQAQVVLTNGWANPGTISAAGNTASWDIPANQGDAIIVQVAKLTGGAGFTPKIELFSPDGASQGVKFDNVAARLAIQAGVSGTYSLKVSDASGTGTGTYSLQLAQVPKAFTVAPGDEGGPLTNGAIHSGTISTGDLDLWTIPASQGDRLVFQLAELSGGAAFTPQLEVLGPDGSRLGGSSGAVAARVEIQASLSGLYTVLVSDVDASGAGTYQLQVAQIPGTFQVPTNDEGGALPDAVEKNGTIQAGDLDPWTFTSGPGDHITIQLTELTGGAGFTPMLELFTPAGERKAVAQNAAAATIDFAPDISGTYTLLVSDADQSGTGTYKLLLARDATGVPGSSILTNGATALGSISAGNKTNSWSFTASLGESVVVRIGEMTTGAFVPWLRLYGPTGALLQQNFNQAAAEVSTRATNSGTFRIVVSDGSAGGNQTGDYRLTLAKTGSSLAISTGDEGGVLTNGVTYLAAIDTGDLDAWTFTANAGESVVVRMGETSPGSPLYPWLRLYGPNGALLNQDFNAAAAEVSARATNSGKFTVVVADANSGLNGTGNYRITLAKTEGPLTISNSDEGGPLVNGETYLAALDVGDLDAWTFTANAGETVMVRMGEITTGANLYPWLRLYGPNGALLNQDFNATAAEVSVRVTNSGTFTVVVADGNSGLGGSGNYRISLAKTGSQPSISPTDEGGPLVNGTTYLATIDTGDLDAWTFEAVSGETLIIRMGEIKSGGPLYPWLRLYGPNGALLNQDFNAGAAEVTARATNSGTYLVVVADGNSGLGGSGNYRISLARTGSQPIISANDEGGPLLNGTTYLATIDIGDLDAWTFEANAGDSLVVRMGKTAANINLYPWLRLYGPNGALLDQSFNLSAAEVAVRATNSGTFMVVATDGTSGLSAAGNYRINLAKTGNAPVISAGDEGGGMSGAGGYLGALEVGDLDLWTFTACYGDPLSLKVTETVNGSGLYPWIRLYGPLGNPLDSVAGPNTAQLNRVAPASGTYWVVVADGNSNLGGSGNYQFTVNNLSTGLKFCSSSLSEVTLGVNGIGGVPGGGFVLLTATNAATPVNSWSPIFTNVFDPFGIFNYTNVINPALRQQYFLLQTK